MLFTWQGFFTSLAESIALCLFSFVVAVRMPKPALTIIVMGGVFSGTIIHQLWLRYKSNRNQESQSVQGRRHCCQQSILVQSLWKKIKTKIKKFIEHPTCRTVATWTALLFQVVGIGILFIIIKQANDRQALASSLVVSLVLLSLVWSPYIQNNLTVSVDNQKTARWKNGILTNFWRMLLIPVVAVVMTSTGIVGDINLESGFSAVWKLSDDTLFLVNIFTTLGAYLTTWLACTVNMDFVGFVLPLLLTTPAAVAMSLGICDSNNDFSNYLVCDHPAFREKEYVYVVFSVSMPLLWISQIICCVFYVTRTKLIPLIKEQDLFIQSYYNCPFTDQSLMLNRKIEVDERKVRNPVREALESHVFICTTMYRETLEEQEALLRSIQQVDEAEGRRRTRHFESHIFFDGGARRTHTTYFANQLFSLCEKVLGIELGNGTKQETPYGLQFCWTLKNGMPFYVHLKDPAKVKKKKRWSQVMYMSYVLKHCRPNEEDDDNTFILITDADMVFDREAIEILINLLARDKLVGGACGRVHPNGNGPIVWYQAFDYAIGSWFQKAAEHVLGSVMCCPGCFSVFRASALRKVLPTYCSEVEKAKDFLIKDMGEDRWLCMLMIRKGWRLEYAAAADCFTFCPDEFEELFKQRRRWTPSTLANLTELCSSAKEIVLNNDAVSICYIIYQAAIIVSTVVASGTIILFMAAGITYAMNSADENSSSTYLTCLIILILISLAFGAICFLCNNETQLMVAKVLSLVFVVIMSTVAIGVAVQIVHGIDAAYGPTPTPPSNRKILNLQERDSRSVFDRVAISTLYLAGIASLYVLAAVFHPREFTCLFYGVWYLFCLPSGYLFLMIYSICNLNDVSWGTREAANQKNKEKTLWNLLRSFVYKVRDIWGCCKCCYYWPSTTDETCHKKSKQENLDGQDVQLDGNISETNKENMEKSQRAQGLSIFSFWQLQFHLNFPNPDTSLVWTLLPAHTRSWGSEDKHFGKKLPSGH